MQNTFHLYNDLAWLWPMWGTPDAYADYCRFVTGLIAQHARRPVHTLLDISCGGGRNVFNLKNGFNVTGLDLSPAMLAQARALNPECDFVQGDMRTFQLDRKFDAILMDDGLSHMHTRKDLTAAIRTAVAHLQPGGVMIVTPDATRENFRQNHTTATPAAGPAKPEHIEVVFVENVFDSDPEDEQYEATIIYLIREHGKLSVATDHCILGLFAQDTWREVLHHSGLTACETQYTEAGEHFTVFACIRPG